MKRCRITIRQVVSRETFGLVPAGRNRKNNMNYVVTILTEKYLYRVNIEGGIKYTLGSGKKDLFPMSELGIDGQLGMFFSEKKQVLKLTAKTIPLSVKEINEEARLVHICGYPKMEVSFTRDTGEYPESYAIPYECQIHIGRSKKNDIVLNESYVSRNHLLITAEKGRIRIEDLESTYGTYLNGSPVKKAMLKSGDEIDICDLRMICKENRLYFYNLHEKPEFKYQKETNHPGMATNIVSTRKGYPIYHRSPRIRESLPVDEVRLSHLPNKPQKFSIRKANFLPLLSSGAMAGASIAMSTFSPAMLAMRAAMMISPVGSLIGNSNKKARKMLMVEEEERFRKYADYIAGEKAHIRAIGEKQREITNQENPAPEICETILNKMSTSLWERTATDSDFLQVRMGAGYAPLCVEVKPPTDVNDFHMERDELEELTDRIIQETHLVDDVPARLDLLKYSSVGVIGNRRKVTDLLKNLLVSLSTLHFFRDVRIVGVFDPEEEEEWKSMRWLPHIWDDELQTRYLSFDPLTAESFESATLSGEKDHVDSYAKFREKVNSILAERKDPDFQAKWKNGMSPVPHYIFLFASRKKTECFLPMLSENDPVMGISTIFLYDEQYYLPNFCQYIVNVDDPYDDRTATAFYKYRADEKMWFTMDPPIPQRKFDVFCRQMSAIEAEDAAARGQIPSSLTFLQCMDVNRVRDLNVLERWKKNDSAVNITAPLGEGEGGKLFSLSLHRHCSHGLVAGMTGSGKSELLISWLLSIACNYHPEDVSFVVIDYKGGSTAYALEKLPHVCGIITDVGSGIDRCMQSLEYELRRREDIFASVGAKDIKEYIKGHHKGEFQEAVPRLLIVFDEFKELIKERPVVKKMVDSIAAKGSSLGVHLILATQSPADAVDEGTWNNTQYQICMKVQNAAASKVMIHEPDAAMITQAGRAYVRVGTSEKAETFALIQSAWSGAPYRENKEQGALEVRYVTMDGSRIKTVEENHTRFVSDKKEIEAVIAYIAKTAQAAGIEKQPSPWKTELPDLFSWKKLPVEGSFDGEKWEMTEAPWLSVPVGIFDRPELQMQGVQYMDFLKEGNFGVFGSSQTGKTSLLRTIATSLCRMYSPRDIHLYIIADMAGMEAFPQVGGVVGSGQEEKLGKLINMLISFLEERRKIFNQERVDSLKAYRELVSEEMPAVFVLIDRFSGILESNQDYKDVFVRLFSEGPSKGIYFVYTGVNNTGVPYKLTANVSGAISFMQADRSEYSTLIGQVRDTRLPNRVGNALIKVNQELINFQKAMYEPGENDKEREMALKAEAESMTEAWRGKPALKIPVLPESISVKSMADLSGSEQGIAVGLDTESIEAVYVKPGETTAMAVTGRVGCGKSTMLQRIGQMVLEVDENTLLYCLDTEKKSLAKLQEKGTAYARLSEVEKVQDVFAQILKELMSRMQRRKEAATEIEKEPWIILLIDDIKECNSLPDDIQMQLHRIMTKTKGYGVLVLCGIRQGDLFNFYTQDQLGVDLKSSGSALALSDTAVHYEGFYKNNFAQSQRNAELEKGFGIFFADNGGRKIKCIDSQEAGR